MFEPKVPDHNLEPADHSFTDAQVETWIATRALELRSQPETMSEAMDWDIDGNMHDSLLLALADWYASVQCNGSAFINKQAKAQIKLEHALDDLAVRYTQEVLFPNYKKSMQG